MQKSNSLLKFQSRKQTSKMKIQIACRRGLEGE